MTDIFKKKEFHSVCNILLHVFCSRCFILGLVSVIVNWITVDILWTLLALRCRRLIIAMLPL